MMKVAVMLTCVPRSRWRADRPGRAGPTDGTTGLESLRQAGELGQERIGRREPERDTDADDERGVDQADEQEHLRLQLAHQLGLACGRLEVFAAHDADADARAERAQTNDETGSNRDETDEFHVDSRLKR